MTRLCLLLALLVTVSFVAMACDTTSSHGRYRQMTHRRVVDADVLGIQDDWDATWYDERPSHLSQWYNR